jgi:hypothetical protein
LSSPDRGHGERGERGSALDVEAVDRLDQAKARDLEQVVERLSGPRIPAGKVARERHEAVNKLLARALISGFLPAAKEFLVVRVSRRTLE